MNIFITGISSGIGEALCRRLIEEGVMSREDVEALYEETGARVRRAMELATTRPKLTSRSAERRVGKECRSRGTPYH